jgi:hypothetical protein
MSNYKCSSHGNACWSHVDCWCYLTGRYVCKSPPAALLFNQPQLAASDSPDGWGRHQSITCSQCCLAVDHPFIPECVVTSDKRWLLWSNQMHPLTVSFLPVSSGNLNNSPEMQLNCSVDIAVFSKINRITDLGLQKHITTFNWEITSLSSSHDAT